MDLKLEQIGYDKMKKVAIDNETLSVLEELIGINNCCYDWWELSQGIKNIAMGLKLLK